MKAIYIAGPITGRPNYHAEFGAEEARLLAKGYTVLNPAKLPQGLSYGQYARIDFALIDAADAVVMLPKWAESQGARLEFDYCLYTKKPVYFSAEELPRREVKADAVDTN